MNKKYSSISEFAKLLFWILLTISLLISFFKNSFFDGRIFKSLNQISEIVHFKIFFTWVLYKQRVMQIVTHLWKTTYLLTFLKCIFYTEMVVKNNTSIGREEIVNKVQMGGGGEELTRSAVFFLLIN